MTVSERIATAAATIDASISLVEAAHMMQQRDTGFLAVVEGERLVGVVTDHDIVVRGLAQSRSPFETPVSAVMSIEVVCCFGKQSVDEAKALMDERDIRRLPIIDDQHAVLGVLTREDLGIPGTPKKTPMKVTFSKQKTDSYGRPRKVQIKSVYITSTTEKEAAVSAAVKHFEDEEGTAWSNVADEVDVNDEKGTPGGQP
ncbi:MAG: CBS domain-containing protein [Rhodospirillales bacterium]